MTQRHGARLSTAPAMPSTTTQRMFVGVRCRTPVPLLDITLETAQVGCSADRTSGLLDTELARRICICAGARAEETSIGASEGMQYAGSAPRTMEPAMIAHTVWIRRHGRRRLLRGAHHSLLRDRVNAACSGRGLAVAALDRRGCNRLPRQRAPRRSARLAIVAGDVCLKAVCTTMWCETARLWP